MKFKTTDELLLAVLAILPNAEIGEDNDGQIVIYTNVQETKDGKLKEFQA
jgi:hypothetical protein